MYAYCKASGLLVENVFIQLMALDKELPSRLLRPGKLTQNDQSKHHHKKSDCFNDP